MNRRMTGIWNKQVIGEDGKQVDWKEDGKMINFIYPAEVYFLPLITEFL